MKLEGFKDVSKKKIPVIFLYSSHSGLYLHVSGGKIHESQGVFFSCMLIMKGHLALSQKAVP